MTVVPEMVERVARAICGSEGFYAPDGIGDHGGREANWRFHIAEARAVIEAMREPTDAMTQACDAMIGDAASPYDHWRRMIDAALDKQP